jgi:transposase InsO family protein
MQKYYSLVYGHKARLQWMKMYEEVGNITAVCKYFGISRKTFYKWKNRYKESGKKLESLKDRSTRPLTHPKMPSKEIILIVIKEKRDTGYKLTRLHNHLKTKYNFPFSVFGLYKILLREGLIEKPRKRKRSKKPILYSLSNPGDRIQVDVKHIDKREDPHKEYQYTAIDDCTRVRFAKIYSELTPKASVEFLRDLVEFFPFSIGEVQTDHGVEFTYNMFGHVLVEHPFDVACIENGINHRLIDVGEPTQNGKVERSHRIDEEEFYSALKFKDKTDRRKRFNWHIEYYNKQRPHGGIGWLTPWEKLESFNLMKIKQCVTQV